MRLGTLLHLASTALASAHMQLHYPAPFNAPNNPHVKGPGDPYLRFPYDCCGEHARWTYPCRGYLSLLGTEEGAPTAIWEAGSNQTWSVNGTGNHYGGSCQVGFMDEKGRYAQGDPLFRVATSYEGNCPHRDGGDSYRNQTFDFVVPRDLELGVRVFAWIWYNREQEFNMNCAAVNIIAPKDTGGEGGYQSGRQQPADSTTTVVVTITPSSSPADDLTTTVHTTIHKTLTTLSTTTIYPPRRSSNTGDPSPGGSTTVTTITITPSSSAPASQSASLGTSVPSSSAVTIIPTAPSTLTIQPESMPPFANPADLASYGETPSPPSTTLTPSPTPADIALEYTTTTVVDIAIITVSGTKSAIPLSTTLSSSSLATPLFDPSTVDTAGDETQTWHTANGCSCTCPAGDDADIEECVCYCFEPDSSTTSTLDLKALFAAEDNTHAPGPQSATSTNIARPDDHVVYRRSLEDSMRKESYSTESRILTGFVPFHSRPLMLVADDGNGCLTPWKYQELMYPEPGPDVVAGDGLYDLAMPNGTCSRIGNQGFNGVTSTDRHV